MQILAGTLTLLILYTQKADQLMSQESDRAVPSEGLATSLSPGYGLSQPLADSPNDPASARQKINLKSGKALPSDPAPVDGSGKKVGRQRSGFFGRSKSSRKVETSRRVGSDREKHPTPSEEYSPMTSSRITPARSSTPTGAEVADPLTDDTTTVLEVGFGESGAVKICQLGDIQPTHWPGQRSVGSKRSENPSNCEEGQTRTLDQAQLEGESLTNVEDGDRARKIRSAGLALHGKIHRLVKLTVERIS